MEDKIKFLVKIGKSTFEFESGAECYIFHTGIYNDILENYNMDVLLDYVQRVYEAYLADSDSCTPLGALADYMAVHLIECKNMSKYELLDDFYEQYNG